MCLVGEWNGDTGDTKLEALLLGSFRLIRRLALPNWTDTAHELTIWQRVAHGEESAVADDCLLPIACSGCSTGCSGGITTRRAHSKVPDEPVAGVRGGVPHLRRCRYCREVAYCSVSCAEADSERHAEVHALRLMFFKNRETDLASDADYAASSSEGQ